MRIFVTGATGFVGSAVVRELIGAGHRVLGMARSDAGAQALAAMGAEVHRGSLEDAGSLRSGAASTDGVIHTAFIHDFSRFQENSEIDRRAIAALGAALRGSGRPLIVTSGMAHLAKGRLATEDDTPPPPTPHFPRASEEAAAALAAEGVRVAVMRLPPSVHGDGDHGFVPILHRIACEKGRSAFIGKGLNRWPAVHRLDAARAFRLAIEHGSRGDAPPGERYHAVAEEGVPFHGIAEAIGRQLGLPAAALPPGEAAGHFAWFAAFAGMDAPASSERTRALLDWAPAQPGLLADIGRPGYFGG